MMSKRLYIVLAAFLGVSLFSSSPVQSALAVDPLTLSDTVIPLGGTVDITYTNTLDHTVDTATIAVLEPDGDVCRYWQHNVAAGDGYTVTYPDDFKADLGSVACDTNQLGEFLVKSRAGTPEDMGRVPTQEQLFMTSFFVVPESPVGVAALMGSSLAALGAYVGLKTIRTKKN